MLLPCFLRSSPFTFIGKTAILPLYLKYCRRAGEVRCESGTVLPLLYAPQGVSQNACRRRGSPVLLGGEAGRFPICLALSPGWGRAPASVREPRQYMKKEGLAMKRGILYGVGVGPGDPELLTLKARRILFYIHLQDGHHIYLGLR